MGTAVDLQQHPGLGHAIAPPPMTWCPMSTDGAQPRRLPDPLDALAAQDEPLAQRQQLHQMAVVAVGILTPQELHHPLPHRLADPPGRGPTLVPVYQGHGSLGPIAGPQAPDLALRETQDLGRLRHRPPAGLHLVQYLQPPLLSLGHGHAVLSDPGLPGLGPTASPTRLTKPLAS